jgi:hypothetical protein
MLTQHTRSQQGNQQRHNHHDGRELTHGQKLQARKSQPCYKCQQQTACDLLAWVLCFENIKAFERQYHSGGEQGLEKVTRPNSHHHGHHCSHAFGRGI